MSKFREYALKISLVILSTIIALIFAELAARLIFPPTPPIQLIPDPIVGFRHKPNQRVWHTNGVNEFGVWFTTNSHGDPDIEFEIEKPDQVYRIAIIGDSMAEAAQVTQCRTIYDPFGCFVR